MPALNLGNLNMKLNLNPIRVLISSTRALPSQIREKAMPHLNRIYLQSQVNKREDTLPHLQEVTPRHSSRNQLRRVM
jgi:hypothetical protein